MTMRRKCCLCLLLTNALVFIILYMYTQPETNLLAFHEDSTNYYFRMKKIQNGVDDREKTENNPGKCEDDLELLILVPSSMWNFKQREAIRKTWGNKESSDAKTRLLFFTGTSLSNETFQQTFKDEQGQLQDIVKVNITESYDNLTKKSIALLKWAHLNCPSVRYVLKSDDDMFINIQNLVNVLRKTKPKNAILGVKNSHSVPFRDKGSKWYVSREQYPKDKYPTYISGTAYVITGDIISALYNSTLYVPSLFIEDVYLNGLCREKIGAEAIHLPGFDPARNRGKIDGRVFEKRITGHHFSPRDIILMWNELKTVLKSPRSV